MTAKEYLGQAYRIDQRINSEMEQIASLNLLARKATTVFSNRKLLMLSIVLQTLNTKRCLNSVICVLRPGSR